MRQIPQRPQPPENRVFSSSEEVFRHLRDRYGADAQGDMNAIALFAYALIEKDRVDWSAHMAAMTGVIPDHGQVEEWFRSKPDSYFSSIDDQAFRWFYGFAVTLLQEHIEDEKRKAIAQALGNMGKFWPGFWVGNLVGLTSNIAFTLLVVLFVVFVNSDFSFIAWTKKVFGFH